MCFLSVSTIYSFTHSTSQVFSSENKQPLLEQCCIHLQAEIIAETYCLVCNIITSILLKKGPFSYVRVSLKQDEYNIYLTHLSLNPFNFAKITEHSVYWSINPISSKTPPPLFCQAPHLKSAICPSPPFQAIPL